MVDQHDEWDGEERRRREHSDKHDGWRFEKSFSLGNLLTIVTLLGSAIVLISSVQNLLSSFEKRISLLEAAQEELKKADVRHETSEAELRKELKGELRDLTVAVSDIRTLLIRNPANAVAR